MEEQPSMLPFLGENANSSPPAEDPLMFLFSSPATEQDELPMTTKGGESLGLTHHQPLTLANEAIAQIESLMQAASVPIVSHITATPEEMRFTGPRTPPTRCGECEPLQPSSSFGRQVTSSYDSESQVRTGSRGGRSFTRLGGKKRPLATMQAISKRNAPSASLTDEDLVQIGRMYESETQLAESRELYSALIAFKKCLSRRGYRIDSLHLRAVPESDYALTEQKPFTLVLNKDNIKRTSENPSSCKSVKSDNSESAGVTYGHPAPARRSVTMSTSESSPGTESALCDDRGVRPLKRTRATEKGESSTSGQRVACAVCSKKMADFSNLVRHFRHVHQELKPFKCPKCSGFYSSEGTLWHHISNVHTESPRTHKCEYCDASYDSCGAKTRHVHGTHHVDKPLYKCNFKECNRVFVFPAHLESHAASDHDGFRPFACDECPKSFSSSNGLIRHNREVHRKEKAYSCPQCGTGLTKRCHLKRHLLNVHRLSLDTVDEEMKKHPHPGDIPVPQPSASAV